MENFEKKEASGLLIKPCGKRGPSVRMFIHSASSPNAIVLVHGLQSGILALPWDLEAASAVKACGFALVQVNLASAFAGSLVSTLDKDCEELKLVVSYLRTMHHYKKIVVMGHSTGSQVTMRYCRKNFTDANTMVDGVIFLSGVSDREALGSINLEAHRVEADKYVEMGEPYRILSTPVAFGLASTAYRFKSLMDRLGDDDMFSTDLTEEELKPIMEGLICPVLFVYGESDEFVPNIEALRIFSHTLLTVAKSTSPSVDIEFIPGNHEFADVADQPKLISVIMKFLKKHFFKQ